jgi:hypothetical protein
MSDAYRRLLTAVTPSLQTFLVACIARQEHITSCDVLPKLAENAAHFAQRSFPPSRLSTEPSGSYGGVRGGTDERERATSFKQLKLASEP